MDVSIAHLQDIDELDDGRCRFRAIRHELGITTFGVTGWTARAAGDRIINEHAEDEPGSSEELYVVTDGHARFELDGAPHDAPAGTLVRVGPGVRRTAFAVADGTTVLSIGGAPPGVPYRAGGWELFAPLMALYRAGEHTRAADEAQALLAGDPAYGGLYYNVACIEALAGRPGAALEHLGRALELDPTLRATAAGDEDFAALRDHPQFAELTGD